MVSCRSGFDRAPNNYCPAPQEQMLQEFMPETEEQDDMPTTDKSSGMWWSRRPYEALCQADD